MGRVLPRDIIIDILLRLPVKSLLRFKHVSKSWKMIITSPKFAYHHINLHNSLVSTSNRFVIIKCPNSPHIFRVNFDTPLSNAVKLSLPKGFIRSSYAHVVLGGSCNGLICLCCFVEGKFIVLNPMTLTYSKPANYYFLSGTHTVGFGFDLINNDYKIVCVSYHCSIIYSFKRKTWRIRNEGNQGYEFLNRVVGVLVNNHLLHWIVRVHESSKKMIACFDLCTEKWSLINLPDYINFQMQHRRSKLSVHVNGCLCLSILYCQGVVILWMLKDYAVKESWVKISVSRNCPIFMKYHCFCYKKEANPCWYALCKSEKWYAEICTRSLVTVGDGRKLKFSWKHRLSKAFSCLTT